MKAKGVKTWDGFAEEFTATFNAPKKITKPMNCFENTIDPIKQCVVRSGKNTY